MFSLLLNDNLSGDMICFFLVYRMWSLKNYIGLQIVHPSHFTSRIDQKEISPSNINTLTTTKATWRKKNIGPKGHCFVKQQSLSSKLISNIWGTTRRLDIKGEVSHWDNFFYSIRMFVSLAYSETITFFFVSYDHFWGDVGEILRTP